MWKSIKDSLPMVAFAMLIVVALVVSGLAKTFGIGLGVVALGFLFYCATFLKEKGLKTTTIVALVLWTLWAIGGFIWSSYIAPEVPLSVKEAASSRGKNLELGASESMRSHAVDAKSGVISDCNEREGLITESEVKNLRTQIKTRFQANQEAADKERLDLEEKLRQKVAYLEKWRAGCPEGLVKVVDRSVLPTWSVDVAWWLLVACAIVGFGGYYNKREFRWQNWIYVPMIIFVVGMLGQMFLVPIAKGLPQVQALFKTGPAPTQTSLGTDNVPSGGDNKSSGGSVRPAPTTPENSKPAKKEKVEYDQRITSPIIKASYVSSYTIIAKYNQWNQEGLHTLSLKGGERVYFAPTEKEAEVKVWFSDSGTSLYCTLKGGQAFDMQEVQRKKKVPSNCQGKILILNQWGVYFQSTEPGKEVQIRLAKVPKGQSPPEGFVWGLL